MYANYRSNVVAAVVRFAIAFDKYFHPSRHNPFLAQPPIPIVSYHLLCFLQLRIVACNGEFVVSKRRLYHQQQAQAQGCPLFLRAYFRCYFCKPRVWQRCTAHVSTTLPPSEDPWEAAPSFALLVQGLPMVKQQCSVAQCTCKSTNVSLAPQSRTLCTAAIWWRLPPHPTPYCNVPTPTHTPQQLYWRSRMCYN